MPATLVVIALAGCGQPVDAPAAPESGAASVADLHATAERIAAELSGHTERTPPAPLLPRDGRTMGPRLSPAEWERLEEAARRELPAMVAEAQALAARR